MATGLAERNGGRLGLAALTAILLLGLGLRVGEAWDGRGPVYDARAYAEIAIHLERDDGFSAGAIATQPSDNYSPGLPLFVAGAYKASGGVHERLARLLLAAIGTLAVLFAYLIGRRLGGPTAGLIAAAAVAIYPALIEYQGMLMSEPLAATLLAAAVLAIFWAAEAASSWRWLLPGALLGALSLTRPEYLGVTVLLALVVAARGRGGEWRAWLPRAAILLVAAAVVVAPWTVRNAVALDRFVPVSTGGGQVLFAGTYLPSDGDPEKVGAEVVSRNPGLFDPADAQRLRLEQILARLAAHRYPQLESDQALARMGREQLWDDLSEQPLDYAGFLATKVGRVWLHPARQVMREAPWTVMRWTLVLLGLLGLVALLVPLPGAFVTPWVTKAPGARWEAVAIATVLVAITALSALLVASPRRALVMLPLVAPLAGVGATWLLAAASRGRTSP